MKNGENITEGKVSGLELLQTELETVNRLYKKDVADRIATEGELRKSLSLIEATLECSENGILVIDDQGKLVKANKKFAQQWHIPDELIDSGDDERMLRHIFSQLIEPDSFLTKVKELYANPFAESFDLLYFTDGRIFERISKPMIVEGLAKARVWSFLDITERTRTERQRQVMFEISQGVTTTSNLDELLSLIHQSLKKVMYAENCFVALYDPESMLFSFPYFVDRFDERPLPVAMEKSCSAYVFRTGKPLLVTPELFSRLKESKEVELVGSPSPSWIGVPLQTPTSIIGVLVLQHYEQECVFKDRDVQFLSAVANQAALVIERKNSELALYESEKKFRRLVGNINDVVYSVDGKTGEYTYLSPVFQNLMGYTLKDILNMGGRQAFLAKVLSSEDFARHCVRFAQLQKEVHESVFMDENWWLSKDGSAKCIADHWIPVYENGLLISTDGVLRDITDRKKSEEEINRMNDQLQEIIADKDKFFSIIAHDLRSPFNSFLGFTRMMVEDLPTLRIDEIQKIAITMSNSATNLYRLLENLLEWSRLQRGLITFNPVMLSLKHQIIEILQSVQESANKKAIEIVNKIPDDLIIFADQNMMESIFRNLVTNALKYTDKGGAIVIDAKLGEQNTVLISVLDNGIGMNEEILAKLFRLDRQTNRKGTEGEPSTGLGLIICKEFIERHGGTIKVRSIEGNGSEFYFDMPLGKK